MTESSERFRERDRQADLARLRGLRPIDDDFMRCIFRNNIPLAQLVLRILTQKDDLVITDLETQKDIKRLVGARSICLDAYGTDAQGKKYDLEIQRSDSGADQRRARYHSSAMDIENLNAGQDFDDLPDTYTIFITENDVLKRGLPFYTFEKINRQTGDAFGDGAYILYVNGEYRGDDALGRLMSDFCSWDPEKMHYDLMRETARYYKETEEGTAIMCKAFEEVREEGFARGEQQGEEKATLASIRSLMTKLGFSAREAMETLSIPADKMPVYSAML